MPAEALELRDKAVCVEDAPHIRKTLAELASYSLDERGGLIGRGTFIAPQNGPTTRSTVTNHFYPTFHSPSFHTHAVEVEVNPDTGDVQVLRYVVAQDVGYAINPGFVEGQMQGGATQSIGYALSEEIVYGPDGRVLNPNLTDYKMPTIADVPRIETVIVEAPGPFGPFGAKGVGEAAGVARCARYRQRGPAGDRRARPLAADHGGEAMARHEGRILNGGRLLVLAAASGRETPPTTNAGCAKSITGWQRRSPASSATGCTTSTGRAWARLHALRLCGVVEITDIDELPARHPAAPGCPDIAAEIGHYVESAGNAWGMPLIEY